MIWRLGLDWTGTERAPRTGFCGHLTGFRWHGRNSRPDEHPWTSEGTAFTICICFTSCQLKSVAPNLVTPRKYVLYSILTTGLQRGRIKWNGQLTHFGSCDKNSSISYDSVSSGLNIISRDYQKGLGFTAHVLKSQRSVTVAHPEWG